MLTSANGKNPMHKSLLKHSNPLVGESAGPKFTCSTTVTRLKTTPADVAELKKAAKAWTDADFTGKDTLYHTAEFNPTSGWITKYDTCLAATTDPKCAFHNVFTKYTDGDFFATGGKATYSEPVTTGGTSAIAAAMSSVGT